MSVPLFPLNTVLFPGCTLDLQIFEARYLDMIGQCMKQGECFGVVCLLKGEEVGNAPGDYAQIGCEARIVDFQQQDNGLLGIRVKGERRFQIRSSEVQRNHLIMAEVSWLEESPDSPLEEDDEDLLALLLALAEHPMVAALDMAHGAAGRQELANQLGYLLPFTEDEKLELLELGDPDARLAAIQLLLDQLQGELFA